ncbi:unnamed protein product [Cunninghamella echinulata]
MTEQDNFKRQEEREKEDELEYDLVLVDTKKPRLTSVKKNMYDKNLKYIVISYRCGEVDETLFETPDYIAHITSFGLYELKKLCNYIQYEPDLKDIQYVWIDAISVDQKNHERKKEIILKIPEIYKKATYILAVPDLHIEYLRKHPGNMDTFDLMDKYYKTIRNDFLVNNNNNNEPFIHKNKIVSQQEEGNKNTVQGFLSWFGNYGESTTSIIETRKKELKKIYQFLAYLVQDWSSRAWVFSEYQIAKEKYEADGTPLKYIFISILPYFDDHICFSYYFDHPPINNNNNKNSNNNYVSYSEVDSISTFNNFFKTIFIQQDHLYILLNSKASTIEDRFNAILPIWKKYKHVVKDKDTISNWNITDMVLVRVKLYEIMDDLWDKARLLYACTQFTVTSSLFLSFASRYHPGYLQLIEKEDMDYANKEYSNDLLNFANDMLKNDSYIQQHHILDNKEKEYGSIYTENLTDIQLDPHNHNFLSIKAKKYFIGKKKANYSQEALLAYSFKRGDNLIYVYIPFFTYTVPGYTDSLPWNGSGIFLVGNMDQNRWIALSRSYLTDYKSEFSSCTDLYSFNVY